MSLTVYPPGVNRIETQIAAVTNAGVGSLFYADGNGNLVEFEGGAVYAGSLNAVFLAGSILPNADLSGSSDLASVAGASLHSVFWPGINLTGKNLLSLDCTNANFSGATLDGTAFTSAILTGAVFTNAVLTNADLTDALCEGTDFTGATMPDNADTKAEFKALVGAWNAVTTIWTDGNPIG